MQNSFSTDKKNILIQRIIAIKGSIISYSIASVLDIIAILMISSIFSNNQESSFNKNTFIRFFYVFFRTITVFLFRRYAFIKVLKKS